MRAAPADSRLLLPKGWPGRVRSAVVHAISMAHFSVTFARSVAANSINARIRLNTENRRLRQEIALINEEMRIKDARLERIPAQRRPHYPPIERMAILELRAARGWSLSQTARRFLVTPATIASWTQRLDEEGPGALVQVREPVNRFPDFVRYIVQRLKVLCPTMGKVKIAQVLCRVGLHLSVSTVKRILAETPRWPPPTTGAESSGVVTASHPNHVHHLDLTTVPTSLGFWASWLPFALPQQWPFCWWIAVVVDHFSRRVMGFSVYDRQPTSLAVRTFLGRVVSKTGAIPRYLITDHGKQFRDEAFGRWCRRKGIRQRFGAVGKYGSLAVIERLIRTLKDECTRRLILPYNRDALRASCPCSSPGTTAIAHTPASRCGHLTRSTSEDRPLVLSHASNLGDVGHVTRPVPARKRRYEVGEVFGSNFALATAPAVGIYRSSTFEKRLELKRSTQQPDADPVEQGGVRLVERNARASCRWRPRSEAIHSLLRTF